jgi:4-amino-4-deoxy-L-arabinose transferase-like glycosyltransferase
LTDQARNLFREESIKKGSGMERPVWIFFAVGIIIVAIGYFFYDFHINYYIITTTGRKVLTHSEYPYQLGGLFLIIAGIVILAVGIGKKVFSRA